MTADIPLRLSNIYSQLPVRFFERVKPTIVANPSVIIFNNKLAEFLNLDIESASGDIGLGIFSGNTIPIKSNPIAMAYAGHQFGNWVPRLGDGRAILLGELLGKDGQSYDIQLKGAGRTPFSRMGDGRSAVGPVLREYLISEAMHTLGVPTTRSLAAVLTGEVVQRETVLPGAILTRVSHSHVRVGTFEYFSSRKDTEGVKVLANHLLKNNFSQITNSSNPYKALLQAIITNQAKLIACWQLVGFIHGVMNTDNCSVVGDTIDYGPCAFIDTYDPSTVFSSIDRQARYSYKNQPLIAQWNLACLAESLLPLLDENPKKAIDIAKEQLNTFQSIYHHEYLKIVRRKLGFFTSRDEDSKIAQDLFLIMEKGKADFTLTFRSLTLLTSNDETADNSFCDLFLNTNEINNWIKQWKHRCSMEHYTKDERCAYLKKQNPEIIPRNHLIEKVIRSAVDEENFTPFYKLKEALGNPFRDHSLNSVYRKPPLPSEVVKQTFCGT
ncbi:MAG: hypothetical protein CMM25_09420 [Rhodospirillaceae bacterium]|nr:hypothetical protein [Rhodospirillaceae bacterium]